jgi:oligoribonuclease NrnB/cAMP/cGMP phosphodiesterase (DHH superfamily)
MNPIVVYHGNCVDGSAAATCAYTKLGKSAEYKKGIHGQKINIEEFRDRAVTFLDFCYPKEDMIEIKNVAKTLLILDHHKTSYEALNGAIEFSGLFDMKKSGAKLAFDWFKPEGINSKIIDFVQDRDLGHSKLEKTVEVNAYLFSMMPFSEETADEWKAILSLPVDFLAALGFGAARSRETTTRLGVERAYKALLFGKFVYVANATECWSEIAGALKSKAEFGVCYYQNAEGRYVYSLQSSGEYDVAELAKSVGGGGHKNAAGFVSDTILHTRI